jgi:type I restriction-modification system DNA methylase subunit
VLKGINFNRRVGQRTMDDSTLVTFIQHFDRIPLSNDAFEFPDLLGAAYEYLIKYFADTAGKKGGEFYTPAEVVRTLVQIIEPQEGMAIYDPCVGSGGMLIQSKQYVEEAGGDPRNLVLAGQELNGGTWSICKMNMILHGIISADIRQGDTLKNPQHQNVQGEVATYDRVIANPPFSQNYTRKEMKFPERFHTFLPESGKKADLMFVQHMVASLKGNGKLAVVMPHGVLFRGGEEKACRQRFIQDGILEAVIGLPAGLFYGTGIPACVLVINKAGAADRESVLVINADREYREGKNQNSLRAEDIEKITNVYRQHLPVPHYSRQVPYTKLAAEDYNLNIRRYVDNSPPPEPHDVRAHLNGGVPNREIEALRPYFDNYNGVRELLFVPRSTCHSERSEESSTKESLHQISPAGRNDTAACQSERSEESSTKESLHQISPAGRNDTAACQSERSKESSPEESLHQISPAGRNDTAACQSERSKESSPEESLHQISPAGRNDTAACQSERSKESSAGQSLHQISPAGRNDTAACQSERSKESSAGQSLHQISPAGRNDTAACQSERSKESSTKESLHQISPAGRNDTAACQSERSKESSAEESLHQISPSGRNDTAARHSEQREESAYSDFAPRLTGKDTIKSLIETAVGVQAKHAAFHTALATWWERNSVLIATLPESRNVFELRRKFLDSIAETLVPQGLLDVHQVRGAIAAYLNDLAADLKSIAASGWGPELIPDGEILQAQFADVLEAMEQDQARIAELEGLFAAADGEEAEEDEETGVLPSEQVKAYKADKKEQDRLWKDQLKLLKSLITDFYTVLKQADAIPAGMKKGEFTAGLTAKEANFAVADEILALAAAAHGDWVTQIRTCRQAGERAKQRSEEIEQRLAAHAALEDELKELKAGLRAIEKKRDDLVAKAREEISVEDAQALILERCRTLMVERFEGYLRQYQRGFVARVETLWDKYAVTMKVILAERDEEAEKLQGFLVELGYE